MSRNHTAPPGSGRRGNADRAATEKSQTAQTDGHPRRVARRELGARIRALRIEQGRTLADLAGEAGISTSLLSQVERGVSDPSLDTLRDIADSLGTAPFRLLAGEAPRPRLVRVDERPRLELPDSDIVFELLSHSLHGTFEVLQWSIAPGGSSVKEPRGHPVGEESVLLLEGHARCEIGTEVFELMPGDLITYDARVPHRTTALGDRAIVGLSIISPPSF